ncbi:MAG: BON domain-containing protein, partial [Planctomycetes bacterium]|nr:BON domain-containing protein [Planctomycetota bacterium]
GGPGFGNQSGFGDGQQNGFGNQNQFGANQNGGILGRNNNQNQLLGRNQQGMMQGNFDNNFNNFGRGNAGRGNRNLGLNQLNNQNQSANSSQTPLVRPRQAVGFDFPRNRPSAVQSHLETRLAKQSKRHAGLSSVTVVVDDQGNVILQGTVKSPADRKLAENLIYLEPGIKKVRNELTIESDTPAHPEG